MREPGRNSVEIFLGNAQKGRIEKISLKETEDFKLKDGSLLMRWHQLDTAPERKDVPLDYATAIMPGYENMRDLPAEEAWKIFNYKSSGEAGQEMMSRHIGRSPTLLLPLQAGVCPFDCKGCPFAANFPDNKGKKTKQIGPEETRVLIQESLNQAQNNSINISNIGISFVGSGDATHNPFLAQIFQMISTEFPNVSRIRFSTVAGKVEGTHLTPMNVVEQIISNPDYTGKPKLSMQVSLHSSDEKKRTEHVYKQRLNPAEAIPGKKPFTMSDAENMLLPSREVANQFERIVQAQMIKGFENIRKPSLVFVCNKDTEINIKQLEHSGFNPGNTVIQLRPILSENPEDSMSQEYFLQLYSKLREAKYSVVLMPVSPSGVELKA